MGILKKARHSKIDVFVKFESAINLEISSQILKKPGFLLFGSQRPYPANNGEPFRFRIGSVQSVVPTFSRKLLPFTL